MSSILNQSLFTKWITAHWWYELSASYFAVALFVFLRQFFNEKWCAVECNAIHWTIYIASYSMALKSDQLWLQRQQIVTRVQCCFLVKKPVGGTFCTALWWYDCFALVLVTACWRRSAPSFVLRRRHTFSLEHLCACGLVFFLKCLHTGGSAK